MYSDGSRLSVNRPCHQLSLYRIFAITDLQSNSLHEFARLIDFVGICVYQSYLIVCVCACVRVCACMLACLCICVCVCVLYFGNFIIIFLLLNECNILNVFLIITLSALWLKETAHK